MSVHVRSLITPSKHVKAQEMEIHKLFSDIQSLATDKSSTFEAISLVNSHQRLIFIESPELRTKVTFY